MNKQKNITERNFTEVESNFVKFEEIGQKIEGEIIFIDDTVSEEFTIYHLKDDNGIVRKFHDSTQLRDLLAQCKLGDYIQIEFIDTEKLPKGELKIFKLLKA